MHPVVAAHWDSHGCELSDEMINERELPQPYDQLAIVNAHHFDEHIVFIGGKKHMYAIRHGNKWVQTHLVSVTKVIEPYAEPFDEVGMACGTLRKLNRLKGEMDVLLSRPSPRFDVNGTLVELSFTEEDMMRVNMAINGPKMCQRICMEKIVAMPEHERIAFFHAYYGDCAGLTNKDQVIEKWKSQRDAGTDLHADIERHINGHPPILPHSIAWEQYLKFRQDYAQLEYFRTEWRIFHPGLLITGTIDCVTVNERCPITGRIIRCSLRDWKHAKAIYNVYKDVAFKQPLAHLKQTSITKYCIQLNLYKFILETCYDIMVDEMFIVVFHKNYDTYQHIPVPHMNADIALLIRDHEARLVNRLQGITQPKPEAVKKERAKRR